MDPNDLLSLLDLAGSAPAAPDAASALIPLAPSAVAAGPTALEVDDWGLRRGRDLVAESERLQESGTDDFAAADFFAAAFDPDTRMTPACRDRRRHEFVGQLLETPEYRSLHAATCLDDTASAIAATHFANQFAALTEDEKASPEASDGIGREMATLRAVGRALAGAGAEVGELKEAVAALGLGPGSPGSNDPAAIAAVYRRIRDDSALQSLRPETTARGFELYCQLMDAPTGLTKRERVLIATVVSQVNGCFY